MSEPSPVAARLNELGVPDDIAQKIESELGATTVEDLAGLTETDLTGVGMKPIPARKLVAALKPATPTPAVEAPTVNAVSFDSVLPAVPTDESWLASLKAGGILKVERSTVIAAVRAALAHRAGLYSVPERLVELMERFADESEEQVDTEFYKLRKLLTRRTYGEIFEAIEGLDGTFVTDARKRQLLSRIDDRLWPTIIGFHDAVVGWQQAWMQGAANPALMMNAVLAASGGGMAMPPGLLQPPDTGTLKDSADAFNDAVNRVFAGTGVQIASALAYEATRIRETLQNPRLPALTGTANRDMMLKQLGVAVSPTYPRLENNLVRYALGIMQAKDVVAGREELEYFTALFMLGSQIPWSELSGSARGGVTGIGGTARDGRRAAV
ncbi:hypothetical protein HY626_04250 [Candidatus Uhrbacteria bacterium]|nr:hypothetical protein [Candidatus Uhrbacteria bacterium]